MDRAAPRRTSPTAAATSRLSSSSEKLACLTLKRSMHSSKRRRTLAALFFSNSDILSPLDTIVAHEMPSQQVLRSVVKVFAVLGVLAMVWLAYCASYCVWLNAHPLYDDDYWASWLSVYFWGLIAVGLLEVLMFLWLLRTRPRRAPRPDVPEITDEPPS